MDKILVSIYVLAIDEEYDMYIPINEKVSNIIELVQNTVKDLGDIIKLIIKQFFIMVLMVIWLMLIILLSFLGWQMEQDYYLFRLLK